jgi:hypothetical protein
MKFFLGALCLFGTHVWAGTQLQCEFNMNGDSETHLFKPVSDPYLAESIDIGGRFRFKAVVLDSPSQVDSVDLYVSYQTRRQPMILQHAKFIKPTVQKTSQANSLTGRIAVYSPFLGKELVYGCSLMEVTP